MALYQPPEFLSIKELRVHARQPGKRIAGRPLCWTYNQSLAAGEERLRGMMELLRGRSRWSTLLFLLTWASVAATETLPRQVLLLYSYEREFAPHVAFAKQFLPELSRTSTEPIDFIEVSLQPVRVSRSAPDDSMMNHVRAMLAGRQPDLVVPIGGPATAFAQRNRQQLFPGAPMLLAGVDRRFVQNGAMGPNDTAVTVDHEPKRVVENILRVLPDTKTVFVVVGASHLEEVWLHEMKGAFRQFEGQLTFSWANELSFADMLTRCANLPPHSAIFYAMLSLDAAGVPHVEERALAELRAVANAPIFGLRSSQLGLGIVGGPLLSMEDLSRNTVTVARRLLNGESARAINTPTQLLAAPVFDWRELRRWNIDEQGLPPRSQVMFREPTLWQQYKGSIVTVAGVQVMLVVALVASLARRRADRTRRESEGRFRLLSNAAPVMMWIAGPDKLCTGRQSPVARFHRPIDRCWSSELAGRTPCIPAICRAVSRPITTRSIGVKPSGWSIGSAGTTANIDGSSTPARRGFSRMAALKATSARRLTSRI